MRYFLDGNFELNKIEANVLHCLYKFRFLTTEQLLFLTYPELITASFPTNPRNDQEWRKSYLTKYSRVRRELVRLEKFGFLRSQMYRVIAGRSPLNFFTLNAEKFNIVKDLLEIDSLHIGTGWNNDFGDLSIDFYEFPKRIEHHLESINFYIRMLYLSTQFPFKNEIDFVDNVYAARTYPIENGEKVRFRPDAELKIHGYHQEKKNPLPGFHAWIEIDRATEFSSTLHQKFKNYRGYLAHVAVSKENTPPLILVYTNSSTGIVRRWNSLFNAYHSNLMNYSPFMNLFVCNAQNLFQTIVSFTERSVMLLRVKERIANAAVPNMGFLGTVHFGTGRNAGNESDPLTPLQTACQEVLGWVPHFVLTENNPNRLQLYLFLKYDGYETQGICRVLDFLRKWDQLPNELKRAKEVIPVFYFKSGSPVGVPNQLESCTAEEKAVLSRALWFSTEQGIWFDEMLKPFNEMSMVNPLTYGLYQNV
jgi:hypothetical protein